jgi:hypothetical protein
LTLRHIDDLPVGDVATTIDEPHATEAPLTRAKASFRNHAVHIHTGQETS